MDPLCRDEKQSSDLLIEWCVDYNKESHCKLEGYILICDRWAPRIFVHRYNSMMFFKHKQQYDISDDIQTHLLIIC